jgi:hypothetical protein
MARWTTATIIAHERGFSHAELIADQENNTLQNELTPGEFM